MKRAAGLLILLAIVVGGFFHNCSSGVRLSQPSYASVAPSAASGVLELCIPPGYDLASFYARNLNAMIRGGVLVPDADADGLDDGTEFALDSDRVSRRSRGGSVIDSVCLDTTATFNCQSLPVTCSTQENVLRLNECDTSMLGLDKISGYPTLGLDSDRDDVPDVLEILGGTRPGIVDSQSDPDGDQMINRVEYQWGRNPRQSDGGAQSKSLTQLDLTKAGDPGTCTGDLWLVSINQLPLMPVPEYNDLGDTSAPAGALLLSHSRDENVILYIVKLKPSTATPGALGQVLYTFTKQSYVPGDFGRDLLPLTSFRKAGDVLP